MPYPCLRRSPLAAWPLDETSGTVAADDTGHYDATATSVGWGQGKDGTALSDGGSSQIVTEGPVLRTGKGHGFTVSAWVCLTRRPASFATAVAQDAGDASGFYLPYSPAENRWAFARPGRRALSYSVPEPGTWAHLVGVYEDLRNQLVLHVGGTQEAGINDTAPTAAHGPSPSAAPPAPPVPPTGSPAPSSRSRCSNGP
ncbi:LamG domain-containing protein [Streptomyces sp. NBC_00631]|uniref:LamG-like jellyroll fold domain-containing protein n=1 Tax=Streptomyces sp. NBC_00631 TaxID=2975793 RepID=UPI0030E5EBA0